MNVYVASYTAKSIFLLCLLGLLSSCGGKVEPTGNATGYGGGSEDWLRIERFQEILKKAVANIDAPVAEQWLCSAPEGACPAQFPDEACAVLRGREVVKKQFCGEFSRRAKPQLEEILNRASRDLFVAEFSELEDSHGLPVAMSAPIMDLKGQIRISLERFRSLADHDALAVMAHELAHMVRVTGDADFQVPNRALEDYLPFGPFFSEGKVFAEYFGLSLAVLGLAFVDEKDRCQPIEIPEGSSVFLQYSSNLENHAVGELDKDCDKAWTSKKGENGILTDLNPVRNLNAGWNRASFYLKYEGGEGGPDQKLGNIFVRDNDTATHLFVRGIQRSDIKEQGSYQRFDMVFLSDSAGALDFVVSSTGVSSVSHLATVIEFLGPVTTTQNFTAARNWQHVYWYMTEVFHKSLGRTFENYLWWTPSNHPLAISMQLRYNLGRSSGGTSNDIAYWQGQYGSKTHEQILRIYVKSREGIYFAHKYVFGRVPTAEVEDYWREQIDLYNLSFDQLKTAMAKNDEAIHYMFRYYLGRSSGATAEELEYWRDQLDDGLVSFESMRYQLSQLPESIIHLYTSEGKEPPTQEQVDFWVRMAASDGNSFEAMRMAIRVDARI